MDPVYQGQQTIAEYETNINPDIIINPTTVSTLLHPDE
jgi:hypothetical protein